MNKSKYKMIKLIEFDYFQMQAPVEISKGALLLDNQDYKVLLQLKLTNISSKIISSVYISVELYDDANDKLLKVERIEHAYLDLNAKSKESFGVKDPIVVDSSVRNVRVMITKVVFTSGEVWRNDSDELYIKPNQEQLLKMGGELLTFLKQKVYSDGFHAESLRYFPVKIPDIWLCSCGRPNQDISNECVRCGLDKNYIFKYFDEITLKSEYAKHIYEDEEKRRKADHDRIKLKLENQIKQKAIDEETQHMKQLLNEEKEKEKIKKTKKITAIIILFLFLAIAAAYSWTNYVKPNKLYESAIDNMNNDKIDEAVTLLIKLGDYKDSKKLVEELQLNSKYNEAVSLFDSKDFEGSIFILKDLQNYKDSKILLNEAKYNLAVKLFEEKYFYEAKQLFIDIQTEFDVTKFLDSQYYRIEGVWEFMGFRYNAIFRLQPEGSLHIKTTENGSQQSSITAYWDKNTVNKFIDGQDVYIIEDIGTKNRGSVMMLRVPWYTERVIERFVRLHD